ncbi:MAG TPA: CotH kinase family protein [bacterium]|nr:CotH kinase family protein [bacterium]HPN43733.1 CotH kinase family protein [bacterium]
MQRNGLFYKALQSIIMLMIFAGTVSAKTKTAVKFSHEHGFYDEPFELRITSPYDNAVIKYTLDGTEPATSSTAMSGEAPLKFTVDPANTTGRDTAPGFIVRACAVVNDSALGVSVTQTYLFLNHIGDLSPDEVPPGPGWPARNTSNEGRQFMDYGMDPSVLNSAQYRNKITSALLDIPTISMVTDLKNLFDTNTGIYVNAQQSGREWERPASVELIRPDSSEGFQINCGLRIRGGWHRNNFNPKHGFRLFFREEYGYAKLEYPLFEDEGVDEFDNVDLRTAQNYSWAAYGDTRHTEVREVFNRDSQRDMGQPYTRSRYYHLYINGTYWGVYQTQERSEASFAESYFGGDKEEYDVIKHDNSSVVATDGNVEAWQELWAIAKAGFTSDAAYFKALGCNPDGTPNPEYRVFLDEDNLIDYMLSIYYSGDLDAPISNFMGNSGVNNFYGIFNRNGRDGFRFFRHDGEHTLLDINENRTGPYPAGQQVYQFNPQWLHQQLVAHPAYRMHFADRAYKHFYNGGVFTPEACRERILARKEQIDQAIIAESARWGDVRGNAALTRDNAWLPEINYLLNDYLPQRTDIVLGQFRNKGWLSQVAAPVFSHAGGKVTPGFALSMSAAGGTIYYTTNGEDPLDTQTGIMPDPTVLVSQNNPKKILVPTKTLSASWRKLDGIDDSAWRSGTGGVGYDTNPDYDPYIAMDVTNEMYNGVNASANTSCLIRIPFTIPAGALSKYGYLALKIRYDDGFVAWLNGVKVAEANAPSSPVWNSVANASHEATGEELFEISEHIIRLDEGENILAIQGLNESSGSTDFLILPELIVAEMAPVGKVSAFAQAYSKPISINTTTHVKARALVGTAWSPLCDAIYAIVEDFSALKVTEIHYHPLDEGDVDGREFEFIELRNCRETPLNLTGVAFTNGIDYAFAPNSKLCGGSLLVLAANSAEFYHRYNFMPFGEYDGQLDNSGERITLLQASGDTIVTFKYNDKAPWPTLPDTLGYSLVASDRRPTGDPGQPEYWVTSSAVHGSPGQHDASSDVKDNGDPLPVSYALYQNYPNPFNPVTTIRFDLPVSGFVELKIYNIAGQETETLFRGVKSAGAHSLEWNGAPFASGVYFYRLKAGDMTLTRKLLLLR